MNGKSAFAVVIVGLLVVALYLRRASLPLFQLDNHRPTDTSLGVANTGAHALHVAGAAAVDISLTFVAAAAYAAVSRAPVVLWLVVLLALGELMHWMYGVPTATYVWLFGNPP